MNNTGDFTINQDLNGLQNATIKNTIHTNNILIMKIYMLKIIFILKKCYIAIQYKC